jgi:O-methyltransferase
MPRNFFRNLEKTIKQAIIGKRKRLQFYADGLGVNHRILDFFKDPQFKSAWDNSSTVDKAGLQKVGVVTDMRWRAHVCCWAAEHAKNLEGDFVEFGVHAGLLSMTVCKYLDFADIDKKFYLFDTFEGIPITDGLSEAEKKIAERNNEAIYFDVLEVTEKNFADYANVKLVKGELPTSLTNVQLDKIAYVSIDLNTAYYEKKTIEAVWDRIVPHGIIVMDDYLWQGHESQYHMWNEFAESRNTKVLCLPTGQGMIIKP